MRIGLFGGSFDPIHFGHLLLAETCREAAQLDQVWWTPAATSPHKQGRVTASAQHRLRMLQLALGGHEAFIACDWELERGGVSFTVDTLERLHSEHPTAELFLLLGADSVNDLPTWRAPERICELATPLFVRRPNSSEPDWDRLGSLLDPTRRAEVKSLQVSMPLIELSSTEIRQRIAESRSIRYRTPAAVVKYIETQRLYRSESSTSP
ncbi:MAG: nicotinate (nicotinamide) nucleotide adenylyltransferase [Planctomycetales bacterium]|nr:nicotinate (nicotinamide) nucleotide adenylyltransferase [Planctomycetales bacterium]